VPENKLVRGIFCAKGDELTVGRRKVHNEVLNYLYSSPNTLRWVKSGRMWWAGDLAFIGDKGVIYRELVEITKEMRPLANIGVDKRIIMRWNFRKWGVGLWTGSNWLRMGIVAGTCELGNEPKFSVKCGKIS